MVVGKVIMDFFGFSARPGFFNLIVRWVDTGTKVLGIRIEIKLRRD